MKMNIMHISPKDDHSCFTGLVREQAKKNRVHFVTLDLKNGSASYRVRTECRGSLPRSIIDCNYITCFEYDRGLRRVFDSLLKAYAPEVVHLHFFSGVGIAPILNAATGLRIKKIVTLHDHALCCLRGTFHDSQAPCAIRTLEECRCAECHSLARHKKTSLAALNAWRLKQLKDTLRMADAVICPSREQKMRLARISGDDKKLRVLYYGVDLPRVNGLKHKKISAKPVFGYLGTLNPLKGLSTIESALHRLDPQTHKILICARTKESPEDEKTYLHTFRRFGNVGIIENSRHRYIYRDFFKKIDCLIVPSLWNETGPMTLLEAVYFGVPVLVADQPSMTEKIRHYPGARIFRDSDELVRLMRKISGREIRLKRSNRPYVLDMKEYAREIAKVYKTTQGHACGDFVLTVGYECSNNCVFCVRGNNMPKDFVDFSVLSAALEKYREKFEHLVLTGGEPSLRSDFLAIVEVAYRLGYKIALQTNARAFADKQLCRRISPYHLCIYAHLESYRPDIHDAITRRPGSFSESVKGLMNLRACGLAVTVKIMLTKINYKDMLLTAKFIGKLNVDGLSFVFLTPVGYSDIYFNHMMPRYAHVLPLLKETVRWARHHSPMKITIEGLPNCALNSRLRSLLKENRRSKEEREGIYAVYPHEIKNVGRSSLRERLGIKIKPSSCASCVLYHRCEGIYKRYAQAYGMDEFSPIES